MCSALFFLFRLVIGGLQDFVLIGWSLHIGLRKDKGCRQEDGRGQKVKKAISMILVV